MSSDGAVGSTETLAKVETLSIAMILPRAVSLGRVNNEMIPSTAMIDESMALWIHAASKLTV